MWTSHGVILSGVERHIIQLLLLRLSYPTVDKAGPAMRVAADLIDESRVRWLTSDKPLVNYTLCFFVNFEGEVIWKVIELNTSCCARDWKQSKRMTVISWLAKTLLTNSPHRIPRNFLLSVFIFFYPHGLLLTRTASALLFAHVVWILPQVESLCVFGEGFWNTAEVSESTVDLFNTWTTAAPRTGCDSTCLNRRRESERVKQPF